jgi:pyruvate dehydrogenase E2 component (dihydrolipoamide acetyltransferase)
MATAVEMPKLGNTVEDCLLATWHKHQGDDVKAGDVIAEIETDKTNFDLTAPVDGVLLETFFDEGALVPVFTPICAIGARGETTDGLRPDATGRTPMGDEGGGASPSVEESARPTSGPVSPLVDDGSRATTARLSPRARRFARDHGFSPPLTEGTGPGGRVLEDDVRRAWRSSTSGLSAPSEEATRVPPEAPAVGSRPPGVPLTQGAPGVSMSTARQTIARRVTESLASTAQYTLHASANAAGLLDVRQTMKGPSSTVDINITDLVVFLTVRALLDVPELNATFDDGLVYRHPQVDLGFACDTDRGLVVPVVRSAQDLSLLGLARRVKELTAQARAGTIAPDDLIGGTFTVSNLGPFGVESFTPVLNPPQVAILGVGAIQVKPARKPDGNLEFIDTIGLSLTLDHQVIDGAPGARFLRALRDKFEAAERLCTT